MPEKVIQKTINFWLIKCRLKNESNNGWDWCEYFDNHESGRDWGGDEWVRSPQAKGYIKTIKEDDIAVCYQVDYPREIRGMTVFASDGKEDAPGSFSYLNFVAARR